MDKIEKQAIRITKRFYKNLKVVDETQFDGLKMDVETTIRRFTPNIDLKYYETVIRTQTQPYILKEELKCLVKEIKDNYKTA